MARAVDVAAYIRREAGNVSRMKLQKLLYYAQAWSLVWDDEPLFSEPIQAWERGPVVRQVWALEKHGLIAGGHAAELTSTQADSIDAVIDFYARFDGGTLSEYTHVEAPWRMARAGLPTAAPSTSEITHPSMRDYYGRAAEETKRVPHAYAVALRELADYPPELLDELMAPEDSSDVPDFEAHLRWLEGDACPVSRS